MSSGMRLRLLSPLLLAAATTVGAGLATPAAAQRVEVYVNGQRVTDIMVNGRVNGSSGAVNGYSNGAANGYRNGAMNGHHNGAVNGTRYMNGFRNGARVVNGTRYMNGQAANGARYMNGARYVNGARVNGGNGAINGNGLRRGFHSHSHVGPYDECFRDRVTGQGHCTGRHWGPHSGPHRGLHRGTNGAVLY
jgi:hypothetical protein